MSEHELWNELGNLYFLSGSYNQAVHAYNKAIQLDSGFGKPLSNLALIYTKQAKYENAIHLYKKSLELLTDDDERAITWNRLGNVYRQLKNYQDAVIAYQSADEIRCSMVENKEQPNQMVYVASESESLSYEVFEDKQGSQNHSADYMLDVEPEFDEALPEFEPVEAEMPVSEIQYNQNTLSDWKLENIAVPVHTLPVENVEQPEPVILEDKPSALLESVEVEKISQVESETEMMDDPGEQIFPKAPMTEIVATEPDGSVLPEAEAPALDDSEISSDDIPPTISEADTRLEEDAPEKTDPSFPPIAQAENAVEVLPNNLTSAPSEAVVHLDDEASAKDDRPTKPVILAEEDVEDRPSELGPTVTDKNDYPDNDTSEKDSGVEELVVQAELADEIVPADLEISIHPEEVALDSYSEPTEEHMALIENKPDVSAEFVPDTEVESALPMDDATQMAVCVDDQEAEKEIGAEEEKLTEQLEINPRNAKTWEALGTLYKTTGRYEEAIQAFEQAVSIAPKTVSYYHNLGLVYSVSGSNEGAFNAFQKVLEIDPNHSLTHASLGGYYKKIGLEELAQQHIEKAMKRIYESENEYNRACLDAICGNTDQAVALLRTALEKKQTYIDWVLHDPDLDSLRDDDRFKQLISEFSK